MANKVIEYKAGIKATQKQKTSVPNDNSIAFDRTKFLQFELILHLIIPSKGGDQGIARSCNLTTWDLVAVISEVLLTSHHKLASSLAVWTILLRASCFWAYRIEFWFFHTFHKTQGIEDFISSMSPDPSIKSSIDVKSNYLPTNPKNMARTEYSRKKPYLLSYITTKKNMVYGFDIALT